MITLSFQLLRLKSLKVVFVFLSCTTKWSANPVNSTVTIYLESDHFLHLHWYYSGGTSIISPLDYCKRLMFSLFLPLPSIVYFQQKEPKVSSHHSFPQNPSSGFPILLQRKSKNPYNGLQGPKGSCLLTCWPHLLLHSSQANCSEAHWPLPCTWSYCSHVTFLDRPSRTSSRHFLTILPISTRHIHSFPVSFYFPLHPSPLTYFVFYSYISLFFSHQCNGKLHESRDFCFLCSMLYTHQLERCIVGVQQITAELNETQTEQNKNLKPI